MFSHESGVAKKRDKDIVVSSLGRRRRSGLSADDFLWYNAALPEKTRNVNVESRNKGRRGKSKMPMPKSETSSNRPSSKSQTAAARPGAPQLHLSPRARSRGLAEDERHAASAARCLDSVPARRDCARHDGERTRCGSAVWGIGPSCLGFVSNFGSGASSFPRRGVSVMRGE